MDQDSSKDPTYRKPAIPRDTEHRRRNEQQAELLHRPPCAHVTRRTSKKRCDAPDGYKKRMTATTRVVADLPTQRSSSTAGRRTVRIR